MTKKNKKLEWYAFREDFNKNELVRFNVLGEWFAEDLLKRIKSDKINSYEELRDRIGQLTKLSSISKTILKDYLMMS